MLCRSGSVMCLHYLACPWRAGRRSRVNIDFFQICQASCWLAVFLVLWESGNRWPFKYNFIDTVLGTFSLASTNLSPLSRNKWATCCCHLLSNLHIMKGSPGRNAWGENTDLVTTYDPKDKTATLSLSGFSHHFRTNLWNGTRMDQREIISVLFCQRLFSFLFKTPHILAFWKPL